jgi:hypothetical protein
MYKVVIHINGLTCLTFTFARSTVEYRDAARNFVGMAYQNSGHLGKILCPCTNCQNLSPHGVDDVYEHLVINGIDPTYTNWFHHGEHPSVSEIPKEVDMSDTYNLYCAT